MDHLRARQFSEYFPTENFFWYTLLKHGLKVVQMNHPILMPVLDIALKVDTWPNYTDEDRETIRK